MSFIRKGWTGMAAVLIDTNILVYAHDPEDSGKQELAIHILRRLQSAGSGRLSTQILAEFFSAMSKLIRAGIVQISPAGLAGQVESISRSFPVFPVTAIIVNEAVRGVLQHGFSYFDAQIWATARLNQVPSIYSEDFNPSIIEGVRFINPFELSSSSGIQAVPPR